MKPSSIEIRDRYGSLVARVEGTMVDGFMVVPEHTITLDASARVYRSPEDYPAEAGQTKAPKRTITETLDELVDAALRVLLPPEKDYTKGCLRAVFRKILS